MGGIMEDETTPLTSQPEQSAPKNHRAKHNNFFVIITVVLITGCFLAGFLGNAAYNYLKGTLFSGQTSNVQDGNQVVTKEEDDIAGVASKVAPSVVSIVTSVTKATARSGLQEYEGAGSGIIVGSDGYVMTNKHVVDGSKTVSVTLNDGTTYDNVAVIGTDPLNDIAFLKIPGVKDLPTAELGDSKTIRVGQKVVAIGNALGQYKNTVTSGIISGTGRPITAQSETGANEDLTDLIQTDAAINSGNSGGPLLNLQGQVIGINTAIAQDAQGIGFALPVATIKGMLKGVLTNGKVEHAYLGVRYISITPDVVKQYGLSIEQGSYVIGVQDSPAVVSGSPADKAGIKEKDIITAVNGTEIGAKGSMASLVAEYSARDTIKLTIQRDGKMMDLSVTLAAYQP
ncbi:MAG: trypsin-like peptidase domain-containing protein [Candidatus Saccharibacteria bacterium]